MEAQAINSRQEERKIRKGRSEARMGAGFFFLFLFAVQVREMAAQATVNDADILRFALTLEHLEAEFYAQSALGNGLDVVAPDLTLGLGYGLDVASDLTLGGPPPIGARKASLDPTVQRIVEEFAYQKVGHLRAIVDSVGGIPRPLLDLSSANFANIVNNAVGKTLVPPFDPYANSVNYLLASYLISYVGLVGYVGAIPNLHYPSSRALVASLLGVKSGQDAVIRTLLYERQNEYVHPYDITVAQFTVHLSQLRNRLANSGIKDEGLVVPLSLGAENRTESNILSADAYSLSYARSPVEILRTVYGSGDESVPGGFFPEGGNGKIAQYFLRKP